MSANAGRPILMQGGAAKNAVDAADPQPRIAADPELVALLKRTMPFGTVSEEVMARVAALARRETLGPGRMIYHTGDAADDIYIMVSGRVQHTFGPEAGAKDAIKILEPGEVFGWAALLEMHPGRLATATTLDRTEVVRINGEELLTVLAADPISGDVVMSRFATLINRNYTVPETIARVRGVNITPGAAAPGPQVGAEMGGLALTMFRVGQWLKSPRPYLMLIGFALFLGGWYLAVQVWKLPRFEQMPGLTVVIKEWLNPNPVYGLSVHTPEYYTHIWSSVRRVTIAFFLATALGVPLGLFLGWSQKFREYIFPVFETLRPIPILAWVPLAILMFKLPESSVIFLTFLASFFATALNTMLGVQSIDESYTRAASCLGANKWQVFRHVIVPGALPYIFTGLQISVGVAWFSLVAAEMVSGQYGLGYVINTSYTDVKYPTIVIGMITLGAVGYITSAMVRIAGDYMMQWRVRELALGGQ
jgi:ABC-type nitrate/sulfonate/bicarbonate transport system permease component